MVSATLITAAAFNAFSADVATGLSTCILKDGTQTVTANIPLGGFKITGLGAGTARTDGASLATIQDGTGVYVGTVGGTADVITLTSSPAITAYAAGQTFRFIASGANTTNVTVAVSGLAAKAITKNGTTALVANDILSGMMVCITYDGTRFILGTHLTSDIVTLTGTQTLTNKTLTSPAISNPVFSGSATGTYTLAGTPTIASATLQACSVSATAVAALGVVGNKQLTQYMHGFTYRPNAGDAVNDIDLDAGGCLDATATYWLIGAALTKQADVAWAVGTNAGGLDTGAVGNSDYYIWLIARSDTGVVDYLFSLSSTAPTMPANYSYKRLIGWFKRVGGTNVAFKTYETDGGGIELLWAAPTLDVNLANTLTTTRRTDAVKVPLNVSVTAHLSVVAQDAGGVFTVWISCPDQTDAAPSTTAAPLNNLCQQVATAGGMSQQMHIRTSATGTIAARCDIATMDFYGVSTMGFSWSRRV